MVSSPIHRFSSIARWSIREPISRAAAFSARIRSCSSGRGGGQGNTISSWISPRKSDFANEETARSGFSSVPTSVAASTPST